jgi:hypothetical protein
VNWIRIVYTSGAVVDLKCESFKVERRGGEVDTITWSNDVQPRPLHAGVDHIAAVFTYGRKRPPRRR